jgi:F420-dependent oxidoreductase-like protein
LIVAAMNTRRIRLGTGIAQLAARPPATLAMQALSLDAVAGGGRTIVGVGVSGPSIVEGWYGLPWGRPVARLRDYVTILRKILDRNEPVAHEGTEIALPYRGPGSTGEGRPLKTILHPAQRIPIWVACDGPRSVEVCAELADGWLPNGVGSLGIAPYQDSLAAGFARRGEAEQSHTFEVFRHLEVILTNDVAAEMTRLRRNAAFYVGAMGSASRNYHRDAMVRRGFPDEATRVHELWARGDRDAAVAAIPDEYLEQTALIGSRRRITEQWNRIACPGVTGVTAAMRQVEAVDLLAEFAGTSART